jgi:ATP-dependent DNA helicase RecG
VREAILNAIVHKDYAASVPIQIRVYDDRIRFANTGRLPADWTIEKLVGSHPSMPRNPSIANVFYLAGHIETWGRGIEKIMNACRDDGIHPPRFDVSSTDITVEFTAPEERIVRTSGRTVDVVPVNVPVGKIQQKVLDLLRENAEMTAQGMAERLGVTDKTIKRALSSLKNDGVLERVGSDKAGHWLVKL